MPNTHLVTKISPSGKSRKKPDIEKCVISYEKYHHVDGYFPDEESDRVKLSSSYEYFSFACPSTRGFNRWKRNLENDFRVDEEQKTVEFVFDYPIPKTNRLLKKSVFETKYLIYFTNFGWTRFKLIIAKRDRKHIDEESDGESSENITDDLDELSDDDDFIELPKGIY
jgi:hypothetical protein